MYIQEELGNPVIAAKERKRRGVAVFCQVLVFIQPDAQQS